MVGSVGHTRDDQRPICRNRKYFPGVKLFTRGVSDLKLQYDPEMADAKKGKHDHWMTKAEVESTPESTMDTKLCLEDVPKMNC